MTLFGRTTAEFSFRLLEPIFYKVCEIDRGI